MDDLTRLLKSVALSDVKSTAKGEATNLAADPLLAVATVVNTRGSAYRRPGARMLVHRSLKSKGAVSAGCLERDIIAHCEIFKESGEESNKPLLLTYDGTSADELVFGLKLGCDGIVQVLVEAAGAGSCFIRKAGRLGRLLPKLLANHKRLVAVTLFDIGGGAASPDGRPYNVGLCMLETGSHTYGLDALPQLVQDVLRRAAQELLLTKNPRSYVLQKELDGFNISALIEIVEPTTSLLIFGGGQDVQPLAEMADILGWAATVQDPKGVGKEEIGGTADFGKVIAAASFNAAVVMTHDYELDRQILKQLIKSDVPYIGIVGPRRRADKLIAELALDGQLITENELARLYSPVGLDIGAEGPEEIALSILSEIKAVIAGHDGAMLRRKQGPIHQPLAVSLVGESAVGAVGINAGSDVVTKANLSASCRLES